MISSLFAFLTVGILATWVVGLIILAVLGIIFTPPYLATQLGRD